MKGIYRFLLVSAAAVVMAVDINTFVHTGGLLPGGFSGISLLVQDIFKTYFNIKIPYSPIYWGLNVVPAAICFKYVGKKFTLYSVWMLVLCGVLTDLIPGLHVTDDILLTSVFGGILNGVSVCLCLFAGATSGGTDFISIFVSEKTGKTIWNYILIWDCFVLVIFGILFGWNRALYSIIFQFASTQILNTIYRRYQKYTLFIVTNKADEIIALIRNRVNHTCTIMEGKGGYTGDDRKIIYAVISSTDEFKLVQSIKEVDPDAFINTIETKFLKGNFFMKKND